MLSSSSHGILIKEKMFPESIFFFVKYFEVGYVHSKLGYSLANNTKSKNKYKIT